MTWHDSHPLEVEQGADSATGPAAWPPAHASHGAGAVARRVVNGPEGRMVGPFALADHEGRQVRFQDYRGRRNLVILFQHGLACASCGHIMQVLADGAATFRAQQTAVLAIGPDQSSAAYNLSAELGHAFPLLSDPEGRTAVRAGFVVPALIVADRWGEIWAAWEGGADHALPHVDELEEWLVTMQCDCT